MKQILQSLKSGETMVGDIPCPLAKQGELLIRSSCSLISAGTERMLIEFGKANPIEKARQQPDKFQMVLDKIRTDGLMPTMHAIYGKLEQTIPLGYCNVGEVLEVGDGLNGFSIGDRVASNGCHAEVVSAPVNLCAKIPFNVSDEEAAFTVVGAIALQGIRLANPTLGEAVVVIGLGLIGQLAVQLLRANGCRVLGIDYDPDKIMLAKSFGVEVVDLSLGEDPVKAAELFSKGRGVDAVLITAATLSNEPMHQAALMCRKRGRIVLVGVVGLELARDDFFKKELTFQVSASYGPGRYDPNYEEKGQDYPIGFVRWTEQRNFEAVLDMMADGRLNVRPLITHKFDLDQVEAAYKLVAGDSSSLGIILQYKNHQEKSNEIIRQRTIALKSTNFHNASKLDPNLAFIGSGNYATGILIPAFKRTAARLVSVASRAGLSSAHAGKKFGFIEATTDSEKLFNDQNINALVISTRHDSHAALVLKALRSGKHVYVEKPLCLSKLELLEIEREYKTLKTSEKGCPILMVGFNRRFAPQVQKIKSLLLGSGGPRSFIMTVNAGEIQEDSWVHDLKIGGGRIVGEACHFIDLLRFLSGSQIVGRHSVRLDSKNNDTVSIQLKFADGSIGIINYFSNGSKAFPKERLEIFSNGGILQLDNFRKLTGYGWSGFKSMHLWSQDKGHNACAKAFVDAVANDLLSPIPAEELFEVSSAAIEISEAKNNFD